MFVPLRWRFFTGFNVLRSEEEKRRDYHRYLMLSFIRGIKEASKAIIAMADAIGKAGDSIMDFALQVNEMQEEIPDRRRIISSSGEDWGEYLRSTPEREKAGEMRTMLQWFRTLERMGELSLMTYASPYTDGAVDQADALNELLDSIDEEEVNDASYTRDI